MRNLGLTNGDSCACEDELLNSGDEMAWLANKGAETGSLVNTDSRLSRLTTWALIRPCLAPPRLGKAREDWARKVKACNSGANTAMTFTSARLANVVEIDSESCSMVCPTHN